jgi:hypothetical protein
MSLGNIMGMFLSYHRSSLADDIRKWVPNGNGTIGFVRTSDQGSMSMDMEEDGEGDDDDDNDGEAGDYL